MTDQAVPQDAKALRRVLVPLALAQFICSFAGSNMNVMINDMSEDLDTTVQGIQLAITIFLLVMAALMIPPVYILTTLIFRDLTSRARAFGAISAAGGIGAAAGPLIGGLITEALSWRAAFVFQALVIAGIVCLSRHIEDPLPADPTRPFDTGGAILSAVGLILLVMGAHGRVLPAPHAGARGGHEGGMSLEFRPVRARRRTQRPPAP